MNMKDNSNNTNQVNSVKVVYYAVIDISEFTPYERIALQRGGFIGVKKYKFGWVKEITAKEVEYVKANKTIKIKVYPDNDCYNFIGDYKVKSIRSFTTIHETIAL